MIIGLVDLCFMIVFMFSLDSLHKSVKHKNHMQAGAIFNCSNSLVRKKITRQFVRKKFHHIYAIKTDYISSRLEF